MSLFKKSTAKIITEIKLKNDEFLIFERFAENDNLCGLELNEQQIELENWWLNAYFPNGLIRKTHVFNYNDGKILLDRSIIVYIKIFKDS
jgi:hypothetical protein